MIRTAPVRKQLDQCRRRPSLTVGVRIGAACLNHYASAPLPLLRWIIQTGQDVCHCS